MCARVSLNVSDISVHETKAAARILIFSSLVYSLVRLPKSAQLQSPS